MMTNTRRMPFEAYEYDDGNGCWRFGWRWVITGLVLGLLAFYLFGLYNYSVSCVAQGGVMVRGLGGYICVDEKALKEGTDAH